MRKLRASHRPGVRNFDFAAHRSIESISAIERVVARMSDVKAAARSEAARIKGSPNFTAVGRLDAAKQYVQTKVAPFLGEAFAAQDASQATMSKLRGIMKPAPIDRNSVAREMRMARWERYWDKLDVSKRATRLANPELCEPGLAELLTDTDYPVEMWNITAEHRAALAMPAAAANHPMQVSQLATQDAADDLLDYEIGKLVTEIAGDLGLNTVEVANMVGVGADAALAGDKESRVTAIGEKFPELPRSAA